MKSDSRRMDNKHGDGRHDGKQAERDDRRDQGSTARARRRTSRTGWRSPPRPSRSRSPDNGVRPSVRRSPAARPTRITPMATRTGGCSQPRSIEYRRTTRPRTRGRCRLSPRTADADEPSQSKPVSGDGGSGGGGGSRPRRQAPPGATAATRTMTRPRAAAVQPTAQERAAASATAAPATALHWRRRLRHRRRLQ